MAVRTYNMPDAEFFQASRTKREHFNNNKAAFVAFDADFDDPFYDDWLDSIEASESVETAETRDDTLQDETQDVTEAMTLAHKKHIEIKYFVEKAFKGRPGIIAKFGSNNYTEARSSQAKMATHLQKLYNTCEDADYKPALMAANITQPRIDSILTVRNSLTAEDTEQNTFKETESSATKERIEQYNDTDSYWKKANAASKSIFYDQPELLNLFLYPRNTEPSSSFNVLGNVTVGGAPVVGAVVQIVSLGLSTTTDNNGEYGFAGVDLGSYVLKFTKAGLQDLEIPFAIGASPIAVVNAVMTP